MVVRTDERAMQMTRAALWEIARGEGADAWMDVYRATEAEYLLDGHPEASLAVTLHYMSCQTWETVAETMQYSPEAVRKMDRRWVRTAAMIATARGLIHPEVNADERGSSAGHRGADPGDHRQGDGHPGRVRGADRDHDGGRADG